MSKVQKVALAEKLLVDIKDENLAYISKVLAANADGDLWTSVLRYEMSIVSLIDGLLESDIILPRLVVCGVRTLAPWHYAALRGTDAILLELWKRTQISPDVPLSGGSTALQFACFAGNISTMKLLLDEMRADIKRKDGYEWSALHYASIGGHLEAVEELCRRGVDVSERDQDGTTPAHRAQMFGHEDIVRFFVGIWKGDPGSLFDFDQISKPNDPGGIYSSISKQQQQQQQRMKTQKSSNSSRSAKSFLDENNYDIPDDLVTRVQCKYEPSQQTSDVQEGSEASRERSKKKIKDLVKSQLQEVFESDDAYLMEKGGSDDEELPKIGFKTLRFLLRSEFQKYKSSAKAAFTRSLSNDNNNNNGHDHNSSSSSSSNSGGGGRNSQYDEHNIYEEIFKSSSLREKGANNWIKGGQSIKLKTGRGPLPPVPRTGSSIMDEQTFKQSPSEASNQAKLRESYNREFDRASAHLNTIEEGRLVKEACFDELVPLLGPDDWKKLALALPIRQNCFQANERILVIERLYPKDWRRQARAALQDWNKHFGKDATLECLVAAMKKCGFVEKIKAVEAANSKE